MPRVTQYNANPTSIGRALHANDARLVVEAMQRTGGEVRTVRRSGALLYTTGDVAGTAVAERTDSSGANVQLCGGRQMAPDKAMMHGTVLDSAGKPVAGAAVHVLWHDSEWLERPNPVLHYVAHEMVSTLADNEWWYVCDVPRDNTIKVLVTLGALKTKPITVYIPKDRAIARVDVQLPVEWRAPRER